MVTEEFKVFTAEEAIKQGLIDSINEGFTSIEGNFKVTNTGLVISQKKFRIKNHAGDIFYAKFKNDEELFKFVARLEMIKKLSES